MLHFTATMIRRPPLVRQLRDRGEVVADGRDDFDEVGHGDPSAVAVPEPRPRLVGAYGFPLGNLS